MNLWKRILTALLAAALMIPWAYGAPPVLSDLDGHWAEEEIRGAAASGWVDGYPDGSFRPDRTITRAEFTKILLDAIHLTPESETAAWMKENAYDFQGALPVRYQPRLSDMEGHWLTRQGWLDAALYAGILVPADYDGGIFHPEQSIARYEMAVLADRALGLVYTANQPVTEAPPFSDWEAFSDWRGGYIAEAVKAGTLEGYPDGTFGADQTATRAEAVVIVQRVLDNMEMGDDAEITVVGQFREYFFGQEPSDEILLEKGLEDLHLRQVGDVIYAPVRELYETVNRFALEAEGDSCAYYAKWMPVEQRLSWANSSGQWTDDFWPGVSGFSFHRGTRPDAADAVKTTAPLRFLYGEVMLPIYDFSKGNVSEENPWETNWYCTWDESAETLYLPLHYFHTYAMSS